jgi:hypothetical protein
VPVIPSFPWTRSGSHMLVSQESCFFTTCQPSRWVPVVQVLLDMWQPFPHIKHSFLLLDHLTHCIMSWAHFTWILSQKNVLLFRCCNHATPFIRSLLACMLSAPMSASLSAMSATLSTMSATLSDILVHSGTSLDVTF